MNEILIMIGVSLFALSIILILAGSFYRKKTSSNSVQSFNKAVPRSHGIIAMNLQYDSKVKGKITVTVGELKFSFEDFFGWIPQTAIEWICAYHDHWKGNGEHDFEVKVKAGDYAFTFFSESEKIVSKIEYSITYYIPKLKGLVPLGLAFIEVSVPLLVTGLVL